MTIEQKRYILLNDIFPSRRQWTKMNQLIENTGMYENVPVKELIASKFNNKTSQFLRCVLNILAQSIIKYNDQEIEFEYDKTHNN